MRHYFYIEVFWIEFIEEDKPVTRLSHRGFYMADVPVENLHALFSHHDNGRFVIENLEVSSTIYSNQFAEIKCTALHYPPDLILKKLEKFDQIENLPSSVQISNSGFLVVSNTDENLENIQKYLFAGFPQAIQIQNEVSIEMGASGGENKVFIWLFQQIGSVGDFVGGLEAFRKYFWHPLITYFQKPPSIKPPFKGDLHIKNSILERYGVFSTFKNGRLKDDARGVFIYCSIESNQSFRVIFCYLENRIIDIDPEPLT